MRALQFVSARLAFENEMITLEDLVDNYGLFEFEGAKFFPIRTRSIFKTDAYKIPVYVNFDTFIISVGKFGNTSASNDIMIQHDATGKFNRVQLFKQLSEAIKFAKMLNHVRLQLRKLKTFEINGFTFELTRDPSWWRRQDICGADFKCTSNPRIYDLIFTASSAEISFVSGTRNEVSIKPTDDTPQKWIELARKLLNKAGVERPDLEWISIETGPIDRTSGELEKYVGNKQDIEELKALIKSKIKDFNLKEIGA
jgi:hypothetical protein